MLTLAVVAVMQAMYAANGNTVYGWSNMVVSDAMGNWLKCFATLSMMVALVYARPYSADRGMLRHGGELFSLAIFCAAGYFHHDQQQPPLGAVPRAWSCSPCPATPWWRCAATMRHRSKRP